jgi:hypothetical protein
MTTTTAAPFPESGVRSLSPKEMLQRAKALACAAPQKKQPACSGQVYVGLFFDGTGNNKKADYDDLSAERRKHSNIVKLFLTYPLWTKRPGHYPFYMPGVGTPFPEIGDNNKYLFDKNRGSIAAENGEARIIWAFTRLLNAPHQYVFNGAQLIPDGQANSIANNTSSSGEPASLRRIVLKTWQDKLKAALEGKKPVVEQINLSVFGFSRGAAEARAFTNWLFDVCERDGGGWTFAGIPIRVQFLGIFDTVASVGLANLYDNGILCGHQSWADNNLEIHPAVEQCVHYVAGHEIRACFPLDSVRVKSHYPANAVEVMYPGAHSDVGGGYAPGALGVSPVEDSFVSVIPGANMYNAARKAGVPLLPFELLDKQIADALTPPADVIKDFNAYLAATKIGAGPVEELGHKHMAAYFSFRFKHLYSGDFFSRSPYRTASRKDQGYLYKTQRTLFLQLWKLKNTVQKESPEFAKRWPFLLKYGHILDEASRSWDEVSAAPPVWKEAISAVWRSTLLGQLVEHAEPAAVAIGKNPMQHAFEVAEHICVEDVTPEVERFFERYVHDSEAGFIDMGMDEYARNGIGFVKFRTVFRGND